MAGAGAEPGLVDPALRMLDPHPDRKGLGFDVDAACVQRREGIARRMADCQDDMLCGQELACREVQAFELSVGSLEILDPGTKAIFPAQCFDAFADRHYHGYQPEGADMRMRFGQDLRRRPGLDEFAQHLAAKVAAVLDPRIELAVGEGPRPALTELGVAFRLKHSAAP